MRITGYDVIKICDKQKRCTDCPLQSDRGAICTPLIVDIKVSRTPSDVYRILGKKFEAKGVKQNG